MVSHEEVTRNYFSNPEATTYNKGNSVYFKNSILYSYGSHFKLAVNCKNGFVINADKYSVSTSKHQSYTIRHSPHGTPQIPFSSLESAKINPEDIYILDKKEDSYEDIEYKDENGEIKTRSIHHLGACLFTVDNRYFLSSLDSQDLTFFLCEIPNSTSGVDAAYKIISGLNDEDYLKYREGFIKRQGEFFYTPMKIETKKLKKSGTYVKKIHVEKFFNPALVGNGHVALEGVFVGLGSLNPELYVRGSIRHTQHKLLSLKNIWHKVSINNVVGSWSAGGMVD